MFRDPSQNSCIRVCVVVPCGSEMSYVRLVGKRGPRAYKDETGDRSARLPLIPVTQGEFDAVMAAAKLSKKPYAEWAREILKRAAKRLGVALPTEEIDE